MQKSLQFIHQGYLSEYSKKSSIKWREIYNHLHSKTDFVVEDFEFYIAASSVYSSKIEGNSLDMNSFMRNRRSASKQKEIKEIEDLVSAYRFASGMKLTLPLFFEAHKMLSTTLLPAKQRGKPRKHSVGVYDSYSGRPVYLAVEAEEVKEELNKLFADIEILLNEKLSNKEVLYFASMLDLWIAMIHPFADGNGRAARLLEKWFLAEKTGIAAWRINSEKYYWDKRAAYYKNISLSYNYYNLKWERCVPFLLMLGKAAKESF